MVSPPGQRIGWDLGYTAQLLSHVVKKYCRQRLTKRRPPRASFTDLGKVLASLWPHFRGVPCVSAKPVNSPLNYAYPYDHNANNTILQSPLIHKASPL